MSPMEFSVSVRVCVVPTKNARKMTALNEKNAPNTRQCK